ncbi:hypothetical protein B0H13DRAFT_2343506 [Mycena leptocephala]|nr:hypothetical protein B0H13DRAFT_2343506 [Mycena leptocephala]
MIVRFFVGDATAICHSLCTYSTTGALAAGLLAGVPTTFDVINTSNLDIISGV